MIWRKSKASGRTRRPVGNWMIRINDKQGRRVSMSAHTTIKAVAQDAHAKVLELRDYSRTTLPLPPHLETWLLGQPAQFLSQLVELGFIDNARVCAVRPMLEHLEEWRKHLKSQRRSDHSNHWMHKANRVEAIVKELGIRSIADMTQATIQGYVDRTIKSGMATKTAGDYGNAVKSFLAWMVSQRYIAYSPMEQWREPTFRAKRKRRVETFANVQKLIVTAFQGPSMSVRGSDGKDISGPDRGILYWFAAETGAREIQCRCLRVEDFVLDAVQPYVELHKYNSKGGPKSSAKRPEGMPLVNPDLVATLRAYFGHRPKQRHAFRAPRQIFRAMVQDLERAGIPPETEDGWFDFHSLRHSFVTHSINSGVSLSTVKSVVGHVSDRVTEQVYLHRRLEDMGRALKDAPKYSAPVQIRLVGGGGAA